jgi:C-terminal processing protease CtpA/Prc
LLFSRTARRVSFFAQRRDFQHGASLFKYCAEIDAAIAPLRGVRDIIIDVRGNGGGSDVLCTYLASYFLANRPVHPYVLRYRPENPTVPGVGPDGFLNPEAHPATYDGFPGEPWASRVWVLVDEACFSATDTFLHLLTSQLPPSRIRTIGRPSQGGIGGPAAVGQLRNTRAAVTVSTCKALSLKGELLEGNPARIDIPVRWTRADVLSQRDPDLEAVRDSIDQLDPSRSGL